MTVRCSWPLCETHGAAKYCGSCRGTAYCSSQCQTSHWPTHSIVCQKFQTERLSQYSNGLLNIQAIDVLCAFCQHRAEIPLVLHLSQLRTYVEQLVDFIPSFLEMNYPSILPCLLPTLVYKVVALFESLCYNRSWYIDIIRQVWNDEKTIAEACSALAPIAASKDVLYPYNISKVVQA